MPLLDLPSTFYHSLQCCTMTGASAGEQAAAKCFTLALPRSTAPFSYHYVTMLAVSQVSHHPPIGVAHAENAHFSYDLVSAPTTKFLGNSLEVFPLGEACRCCGACPARALQAPVHDAAPGIP